MKITKTMLKQVIKEELQKTLKTAHKKTLVIFDVDYVLIMPTEKYSLSRNPYRKKLWQEMQSRLPEKEMQLLRSIVIKKAKWELLDVGILSSGIVLHFLILN